MERKEILLAFLEFLKKKFGFRFNVNSFGDRFKLQKYVFIAGFLGLRHGYGFSRYIRGPYTQSLARDYYELDTKSKGTGDYMSLLGSFDREKFLNVVSGRSTRWLEIAATILSVWSDYRKAFHGEELKMRVISTVSDIKSLVSNKDISEVFTELGRKGILEA